MGGAGRDDVGVVDARENACAETRVFRPTVTGSRRATLPTFGNNPSTAASVGFAASNTVASTLISERDIAIILSSFLFLYLLPPSEAVLALDKRLFCKLLQYTVAYK